jgi:hypothetical protein
VPTQSRSPGGPADIHGALRASQARSRSWGGPWLRLQARRAPRPGSVGEIAGAVEIAAKVKGTVISRVLYGHPCPGILVMEHGSPGCDVFNGQATLHAELPKFGAEQASG